MAIEVNKNTLRYRRLKALKRACIYVTVILISLFFAFPMVYMLVGSLQSTSYDVFSWPPKLPSLSNLKNYAVAFETLKFWKSLENTMIILITTMFLQIGASVTVAYGFARFKNRFTEPIFTILLATMMLPWIVTMVPSYIMFKSMGWIGTRLPLILPAMGGSAYNIFMLRNFIRGIPKSLDESAEIDGCTKAGILIKILIPNMKPILATLVVFAFTSSWSDFVAPSIYLLNRDLYTLSLSLNANFTSYYGAMEWHEVMAGCTIFTLPMVIVLFFAQGAFMRGIVTSGVKE